MAFFDLGIKKAAIISPCKRYRYLLVRGWDPALPMLVFCGLNPSTADAQQDDATIRWLVGYAQRHGYGALSVVNLFAWRATSPKDMLAARHPIQPAETTDNDDAIREVVRRRYVLCGWGRNGSFLSRDEAVLNLIRRYAGTPMRLLKNSDGSPHHPLRVSHEQQMEEIE